MYRNQYLVTRYPIHFQDHLEQFVFGEFSVLVHAELERYYARSPTSEVLLLGFVFSPHEPEKSADSIVAEIAAEGHLEDVFRRLQILSGRYVVLVSIAGKYFAIPDACASKRLYYSFHDENIILTSSPKLFLHAFGLDADISPEKQQLLTAKTFLARESAWIGDDDVDSRLKKILPNHYLDIERERVFRRPLFLPEHKDYKSVLDYTARTLRGTFSALQRRYQIIQPVTAGWDSRILLAASKPYKTNISYYIFRINDDNDDDVRIATRIALRLDLKFEVIDPEDLRSEFLSLYNKEHVLPRILPKTSQVQYHYFHHSRIGNIVNLGGNATEIVRCFYGAGKSKVPEEFLYYFTGYPENPYVRRKIKEWLPEARVFSTAYGIPLLDLFYWEQRIGNWGALSCHEKDIGIEEVWPFNNLDLFLHIFSVDFSSRKWPSYHFFKDLVAMMWLDTLEEKINPQGYRGFQYIKGLIKTRPNLALLAYKYKIKNFL